MDRPLGKDVRAEAMMKFRELAKELAEAARAGDKEAQQKRVYYQGTLETDKANYRALARRAGRRTLRTAKQTLGRDAALTGGYAKGRSFNRKSVTEMAISRNSTMHSARTSLPSGRLSSPIAREIMFSRSIVALFFVPF